MGLPGEQRAAQLLAAVAEGAGEVEIFIAARGTGVAMSWGGLCLGQGSRHPGVHPAMGQILHQWGGEDGGADPPRLPQAGLGKGAAPWRGRRAGSPRLHHHMPPRIPSHEGLPGGPCHVAGAERQSGEGCGAPEVRGCRHFPGYPLCLEPVTRGNTLRTGQRRGVPGGAAAAGAAASHALPAVGSCRPPRPPLSPCAGPKVGTGTETPNKGARR